MLASIVSQCRSSSCGKIDPQDQGTIQLLSRSWNVEIMMRDERTLFLPESKVVYSSDTAASPLVEDFGTHVMVVAIRLFDFGVFTHLIAADANSILQVASSVYRRGAHLDGEGYRENETVIRSRDLYRCFVPCSTDRRSCA